MFTGLVRSVAKVLALEPDGPGVRLVVADETISTQATIGASIAVNGCCLTVVEFDSRQVAFQAGSETLSRTNLGQLQPGDRVNLEPSLALGAELGGHLVTGHIDGLATVDQRIDEGQGSTQWSTFWFKVPRELTRQMASKGSVAVDGISLTLVDVETDRFSVALIPHTLEVTTLGTRREGDKVNIETDLLAKYVERQLAWKQL
jgi:riboflavin synthase